MNQDDINDKWECYLCASEEIFDVLPSGYLANYHPLCFSCANEVLEDPDHEDRFRMTYHIDIGDFQMISNIPVKLERSVLN
jgi:hypothetical protein